VKLCPLQLKTTVSPRLISTMIIGGNGEDFQQASACFVSKGGFRA